ncbi:tetratricopeptide repeat protein [Deferribacteraceae bacterium V6Fe1]|nr:tetratricopeptide repeat protein [Deferribacteraceae bacterium V6Fe1]
MFGRLILILLLFVSLGYTTPDDYLVGLSAFEDGLYDVAAETLEDFLKSSQDNEKNSYAKYILYRCYLFEKNYEKSLKLIEEVEKTDDKRFDKNLIKKDKVFLLTQTDCNKAIAESQDDKELAGIVINSKCKPNEAFVKNVVALNLNTNDMLTLFYKTADNPEDASQIFKKLSLKDVPDKDKDYLAKYFYKHSNYDNFWDIYKVYKNDDLVNLALSRLYEIENYEGFISSFNYNANYKLSRTNYCRLIKSHERLNKNYDCNLLTKCIDNKNELLRLQTACFIKNGNMPKYTDFLYSLNDKEIGLICNDISYSIINGFYDNDVINKFKLCKDKLDTAKALFKNGKYEDVIQLLKPGQTDDEYILIAASYEKLGNLEKSKVYLDKVKNKSKFNN